MLILIVIFCGGLQWAVTDRPYIVDNPCGIYGKPDMLVIHVLYEMFTLINHLLHHRAADRVVGGH
ncbi:protein of unknown function [Tepidanaerobacter acetatoxydans Re1]|uniref:Uncharacterized protein n=1 Tax=Tepidanaerobacter acetatoxydans (strain DSM 21804 / JCM 16047 / Re1) TaxID=1209989 RepID=U4QLD8_TEPAE|nr:protein of unknown function [Tepidanaerobacter acetatoxydans Re1]